MQYVTTSCPQDGEYTITNFTTGCWSHTWYTLTDHTGDPDGYYMLINASYQPSTFYVDTIYDLCGGSSYQFAAWIINMDSVTGTIQPDLTFTIQTPTGAVLQTYTTGNIPQTGSQWQQYAFNFTTPSGGSDVVLVIANNAPGGDGNDLAIDDITFRPIGPNINVGIQGYTGNTAAICSATAPSFTLTSAVDTCYASTQYQWQLSTNSGSTWTDIPGATGKTYIANLSSNGTYLYRLAVASAGNINNTQCRTESPMIILSWAPPLTVGIGPKDTTVCLGSNVSFIATGGVSYQWSDSTRAPQDNVTVNSPATYVVTVSGSIGCTVTDTAYASIYPLPVPAVTQQNLQNCSRDSVTLIASGGISYVWSTGDQTALIVTHPVMGQIYTVTATGANNCTASLAFPVEAKAPWQISPDVFDPPCPGHNIGTISISISGNNGGYYYLWNTGSTSTAIGSLSPGIYSVGITDSLGCDTSYSFNLAYSYTLHVTVSPGDTNVPTGVYVPLLTSINANNGNVYTWSPSADLTCTACPDPMSHAIDSFYTYTVSVIDEYGCESTDSMRITTFDIAHVYIPNAFTPNGDGINDFFQIFGPGVTVVYMPVFNVKVFDRWGEMVYESSDPDFRWDGSYRGVVLPSDVYVYEMYFSLVGNADGQHHKGSVTIIR